MGISRGVKDIVGLEGFQLMFCCSNENPKKEKLLLKLLQEKRVDAIVLAASGGNDQMFKQLAESRLPVVLVDRKLGSEEARRNLE